MIESLYIAESGMKSQQALIEMISNNIANVATPGYKTASANFVDLVYQQESNSNLQSKGIGVHISAQLTDFNTGDLKQTGNPFDIAINGKGFIAVEDANGDTLYTRLGRLRINNDGMLSSVHGFVIGNGVHIPADASDLTITVSGAILAKMAGSEELIELGQLDLVNFTNEQGLEAVGNNLFRATSDSGEMITGKPGEYGLGGLVQGFTEMSNVNMNEEMVNLMLAQRGYQLNARIIQASDQILDTINNLRR